mmetsp:Transcript_21535/g.63098  ORF Transcript_21535/g.63098 Transcript_21535/m.63098 type:complete len:136 (+) Transcript_21535:1099-1506(+)
MEGRDGATSSPSGEGLTASKKEEVDDHMSDNARAGAKFAPPSVRSTMRHPWVTRASMRCMRAVFGGGTGDRGSENWRDRIYFIVSMLTVRVSLVCLASRDCTTLKVKTSTGTETCQNRICLDSTCVREKGYAAIF